MLPLASSFSSMLPPVAAPCGGTIMNAITSAAGAERIEAMSRCATASGSAGRRIAPYRKSTVPAMDAIPPAMIAKSSPRDTFARYGRMKSGASTMPTNTFAAVDSPTAPPTPISFSSRNDRPRTIAGSTRQWKRSAESALITSTIGSARNARTNVAF